VLTAAERRFTARERVAPSRVDWAVIALFGIIAIGFVVRLLVGLLKPLDGDEAAEGIAAINILHGQLPIVESGGHYLGAVESYVMAPFIAIFGPTTFAIRFALSVVGAAYVLTMYALGRHLFTRQSAALTMAAIAALFPFFEVAYGVRGRTYGILALSVALCLLLAIRVAWSTRRRWYEWALFGLAAGLGLWNHSLLAMTLAICALMLGLHLWRAGIGAADLRGIGIALIGAAIGFGPWLGYNVVTHLGSLASLQQASQHLPIRHAVRDVVGIAIPIFLGAEGIGDCGRSTVPWQLADVALLAMIAATIWLRRRSVLALIQLRWTRLAPIDFVLLVLPLSLLSVTVGPFNGASCEPRYLMPAAIPMVAIVALATVTRWRARSLAIAGTAAWIGMTAVTASSALADVGVFPFFDYPTRVDFTRAIAGLEQERSGPMWANYWLARPLQYLSAERLPVGEYGGYAGFPSLQAVPRTAPRPSWVFVQTDPERLTFESACAARGITYDRVSLNGLILYDHLTGRITPEDLGWSTTINLS
jgi:4-amino-4-deoxy-L-arabinose transferase-like glycosyltransferase